MSQPKSPASKKLLIGLPVLVVIAVLFGVVYTLFAPKASAGSKELSIEVVDDTAASQTYTVRTDAQYLRQALEETQGLTIEGSESEYGLMVDTVNGLRADYDADGAYWSFYLGDEYCTYGIDQQPIQDGESYRIVYTLAQ